MCPVKYYDILRDSSNPFNTRVKMVQLAFQSGISEAARTFSTTRDTARKWKRLYEQQGTAGLTNKSRAPKKIPHKTTKAIEELILRHRNRLPSRGPIRSKEDFNLPVSTGAIYRILKQNKRIKKHQRKYERKRDLRTVKLRLRAFQRIQIDVKDLIDICYFFALLRTGGLVTTLPFGIK